MAVIGFIGIGIMGAPMAANLVKAGHQVRAFSRSGVRDGLGVTAVESIAAACEGAEFVITMLPDTPDVLKVMTDESGVLAHSAPGTIVIDMSTIRPDIARQIAEAGRHVQIDVLDAPVSGGDAGAIEGVLSIMVGGNEAAFAKAQPILEAMGTTIVHLGPAGAGQTVKAANQIMVAGNIQMLAEAALFLSAHEVDLAPALEVLGGGLAGSTVLQRKKQNILDQNYEPGFRVELHNKDLNIVNLAAQEAGVSLPATALVSQLMRALQRQGQGKLDHSALYQLLVELNTAH